MTNVTILDSIMGSGKTSFIINTVNAAYYTNQSHLFSDRPAEVQRFLIIVPLLTEVNRIKEACPNLNFKDPQPIHGQKLYHLDRLIDHEENIVTTHALFQLLNKNIYNKLLGKGYTLIIDEVLDCVDMYKDLTKADKDLLYKNDMVFTDQVTRRICWNYQKYPVYPDAGKFSGIKRLCDTGSLVIMDDEVLLWEFPSEFLKCFREIFVCTYMFDGSPFSAYLAAEGFTIMLICVWN